MGRAHNFIVLPTLAITLLPGSVLIGGNAVPIGKWRFAGFKKPQFVEKMTHLVLLALVSAACICGDLVCLTCDYYKNVEQMMIDLAQACYGMNLGKMPN